MLSYVLPTRNRPERLLRTLAALGELDAAEHDRVGGGEVIVVDNNSDQRVNLPTALANGLPLRIVRLQENQGAAARNEGARVAQRRSGDESENWIVMLDDDSHPLDSQHIDVLLDAPKDVAAIGAKINLADGSHERGGLPEVIIGCGAAIRRNAYLEVGGYDQSFEYYAEEYDLCAKLLLAGWRIEHDYRFRIVHEKVAAGRDFNQIMRRLVRNNAWVMQRYAPESFRYHEIARTIERYAGIAMHERAACGFAQGMAELADTLAAQSRTPMAITMWDRFTGAQAVRESLSQLQVGATVCIVDHGKNHEVIRRELDNAGMRVIDDESVADVLMIGTLSPGPMLDAFERRKADARVHAPYRLTRASHFSGSRSIEPAQV